ncbi:hypothetical protein R1sor_003544 [Riccia sorocarpa]|uniref:Uncharacterized protein n=1 Tax=Riccia sorocarpa TaxID=122646 RepID=A0ABD3H4U8_9MARC
MRVPLEQLGSCHNQNPYHRYCGCSLHYANKFGGSPSSKQVKVPNKQAVGKNSLHRTLSLQNWGSHRGRLSGSSSSGSLTSLTSNSGIPSPSATSTVGSQEEQQLGDECCETTRQEENITVAMMEGLVTLIHTAEECEDDMPPGQLCCENEDGTIPTPEKTQSLVLSTKLFHSDTNLCGYTGANSTPESVLKVASGV